MARLAREAEGEVVVLTLNQAIRHEGGLRPHRNGYGREEFAVVPLTLRRRGGLPADEMVGLLAAHGHHFEGEGELLEAVATARPPHTEAELEREAMQAEESAQDRLGSFGKSRRSTVRIGVNTVAALTPGVRDVYLWDCEIAGFGLKLTPAGTRVYLVQYRLGGRRARTRRVTIGKDGSPWTALTARAEARRLLAEVALGRDPAEEKAKDRAGLTIAELCDWYVEEGCTTKKPSTLVTDCSRIELHIKPLLGRKRVADIKRGHVETWFRDIASGKTGHGGKGAATRTLGLLGSIFSFAVAHGQREDNPTQGVKKFPDRHMTRFLSPAELARLGEALRLAEQAGENSLAVAAIRLLALTGCRRGEVLGLRWHEIDFQHSCLRLADSKTGERMVPLGAPAREVLAGMPRAEDATYVMPGVNLKSSWRRVCSLAGLEGVRLHDLRHSFASVGAGGGNSLLVIGALLGHRVAATTQRYAHLADDPVRSAAESISGHIAAAMSGGEKAEVVRLVRQAH